VGDEKYKNWGAALGLNLRLTDGTPWNAKALEIAALKFDIEVTEGSRPIRIQMGQVDDPAISKLVFPSSFASGACVTKTDDCNYAKNSFVYGGSNPKDQKATAAGVTVDLAKVIFPSWTKVPKLDANGMWPTDAAAAATGAATMTPAAPATGTAASSATPAGGGAPVYALATGQVIDLAKLSSLQFQVVTDPGKPGPYHFCVSNVKWLKADMTTEVVVAKRMDSMAAASGSAVSTAPAMTAPAMTGTAPMGSSTAPAPSGTSAAGNAVFEAAWGVFDANCTGCHNGVHGINKDKAKTQMMTKKDADDVVKAVTMGSSAGNVMPKGKPALSTTDIDKLKAWAASRM
jgi:cytochrome c553